MTTPTLLSIDTKIKALQTQMDASIALEGKQTDLTADVKARAYQSHLNRMAWQSERARSSYAQ